NYYANHLKAFILYAKNKDLEETKALLIRELAKDTTRLDILQDIGKVCFYQKDYEDAWQYYKRFIAIRESQHLDIYKHENLLIGNVLEKMVYQEKDNRYFQEYKNLADSNESSYKPLLHAGYYMQMDKQAQALEQLEIFSKEEDIQYWLVLFLECDPLMEPLTTTEAGREVISKIKSSFWKSHARIKGRLKKESLI